MSRQLIILAAACVAFVFAGCGDPSAGQKNEEQRAEIREVKRQEAVKNYKILAEQFPGHEHASEAQLKASELEAKKK